jgi:hypothetical protein
MMRLITQAVDSAGTTKTISPRYAMTKSELEAISAAFVVMLSQPHLTDGQIDNLRKLHYYLRSGQHISQSVLSNFLENHRRACRADITIMRRPGKSGAAQPEPLVLTKNERGSRWSKVDAGIRSRHCHERIRYQADQLGPDQIETYEQNRELVISGTESKKDLAAIRAELAVLRAAVEENAGLRREVNVLRNRVAELEQMLAPDRRFIASNRLPLAA